MTKSKKNRDKRSAAAFLLVFGSFHKSNMSWNGGALRVFNFAVVLAVVEYSILLSFLYWFDISNRLK